MWDGLLQAYNLNQVNLATALGVLGLTVKQGRLVLSQVFQCLFDYHCEPWQVSVPVSPCGSPVQPAELCGFPTSLPWGLDASSGSRMWITVHWVCVAIGAEAEAAVCAETECASKGTLSLQYRIRNRSKEEIDGLAF